MTIEIANAVGALANPLPCFMRVRVMTILSRLKTVARNRLVIVGVVAVIGTATGHQIDPEMAGRIADILLLLLV